MVIFFEATCNKGDPIEVAVATAAEGFRKRFKQEPRIIRINIDAPASVDIPQGARLERLRSVMPNHALAGGDVEGIW